MKIIQHDIGKAVVFDGETDIIMIHSRGVSPEQFQPARGLLEAPGLQIESMLSLEGGVWVEHYTKN